MCGCVGVCVHVCVLACVCVCSQPSRAMLSCDSYYFLIEMNWVSLTLNSWKGGNDETFILQIWRNRIDLKLFISDLVDFLNHFQEV